MSDYFTPLRTLEVDATPLPVEDVMRSGDRRRRTVAAGSLLATTALAAAAVVGGAQLLEHARQSAPPAGPPSGLIPRSFPLGADLPFSSQRITVQWAADGAGDGPKIEYIPPACGTGYALAGDPVDRLTIQSSSGVSNYGDHVLFTGFRDLAVFGTAEQARAAVTEQVARHEACPSEGGDGLGTVTTVTPVALGDGAWRVERDTVLEGSVTGVEVWYLVHRGTAALVVTEFLDQPEELDRREGAARELGTDVVAPILERICSVRTVC